MNEQRTVVDFSSYLNIDIITQSFCALVVLCKTGNNSTFFMSWGCED